MVRFLDDIKLHPVSSLGKEDQSSSFDVYWTAIDSTYHRSGSGRRLLHAAEAVICKAGGRTLIAETSGTPSYEPTRKSYLDMGYTQEASIKEFYTEGDDLAIFVKRFLKTRLPGHSRMLLPGNAAFE